MHQSFEPLVVSDSQKIVGIYRWPILKTLLISLLLFSFLLGLIILLSSFEKMKLTILVQTFVRKKIIPLWGT